MYKVKISKNLIVKPSTTIKEVMRRLSTGSYMFQLVVENNKLLGTIVDGDIRRAILQGIGIEQSIILCMNKNPVVGTENDEKSFISLIGSISSEIKFLPVLNKKKEISYIILNKKKISNIYYLIMAGGYGKRLGSKTRNTPKPLLKINNKPILEHILNKVEKTEYNKIYLSTHYLHKKIEKYISKRKNKKNIELLEEKKPMGTGGSIAFLKKEKFDSLIVMNGDIITDVDLNSLMAYHNENENDITITVANYIYNIPFGVVEFNKNLSFISLSEKPDISNFVLSGIYCLSKECCNLIKKNKIDMTQIIQDFKLMGKKVGIFPIFEYWKDIGNPKDFKAVKNKNI